MIPVLETARLRLRGHWQVMGFGYWLNVARKNGFVNQGFAENGGGPVLVLERLHQQI